MRGFNIFLYFVNYKQLTQKNSKYFMIVKEITITEELEKNYKIPHTFF